MGHFTPQQHSPSTFSFCAHMRRSIVLLTIMCAICPLVGQGAPDPKAVRTIQQFINYNLDKPALSENGEWNAETVEALLKLHSNFQSETLWGMPPWNRTHNDNGEIYSDPFATYLRHALEEHSRDPKANSDFDGRFKNFLDAMDNLKSEGVFARTKPPENNSSIFLQHKLPAGAGIEPDDDEAMKWIRGSLFAFANGVLWNFADELWCMVSDKEHSSTCYRTATDDLRYMYAQHSLWTNILNTIGACFSPLGWLVIELSVFYQHSGCMIFVYAVIAEIAEGIIWAIGDFINFHALDFKVFIVMVGLSALFTGIMALRKASGKNKSIH